MTFSFLAIAMMRSRLPLDLTATQVLNFRGFVDVRFTLTIVAMFLIDFAVLIPSAYMTTYALASGLDSAISYRLIAILNGACVLGRGLPGFLADRWGRFNVMILSTFACGIIVLSMWLTAGNRLGLIIGFTALFGLCSGTAYSLPPVCISQLCRTEEYASHYGTAYGSVSTATLIGVPLSGVILKVRAAQITKG